MRLVVRLFGTEAFSIGMESPQDEVIEFLRSNGLMTELEEQQPDEAAFGFAKS